MRTPPALLPVLLLAFPLAAQQATPSRDIGVGQTVHGALSDSDQVFSDTTYYQYWHLTARPQQLVTVDLVSSDFDPVLIIRGAADSSLVDDDGGPGCDSRIVFRARGSGPFTILVNTTRAPTRQTGRFTLSAVADSLPVDPPATEAHPGDCRALPSGGPVHPLTLGQSVTGRLTADDPLYPDTTYYQRWQFSAQAGQPITVDLSSEEFDPVLIVRGAADTSLVDDDGGPGCASRITFTAPDSGPFTILVNTTETPPRQTGRFTLSAVAERLPVDPPATEDDPGDCATLPSSGPLHVITTGQSVTARLTSDDPLYVDTTYYQRWQLSAEPGQPLTVDLSSPEFDPVLVLQGAADTLIIDDDGGPGCASRITFTAPDSGPFTILVNTTDTPVRQTGRFTLAVSQGTKPVDPPATKNNPGDCHP